MGRPTFGIRHQLWALFGLFLLTGASVLAIDEIAQQRSRVSLEQMKDQSLQRMRLLNAVSEGYAAGVVDTTFKARNALITWHEGVARVDAARSAIDGSWKRLEILPRTPEQHVLFEQAGAARVRADAAAASLRAILQREDIQELGRFADTDLYPAVDPVTTRLQKLSDAAMGQAEGLVQQDIARGRMASALRIGLSLLALLVAALAGRWILRNAYRGVESLTRLALRMREHDYAAEPHYRPSGELGEVMDAFLGMRDNVRDTEDRLNEQLANNERTRQSLLLRESLQRSLLDAAPVAIVALDSEGRYFLFNQGAERLFGYQAQEFVGRDAPMLDRVGDFAPPLMVQAGFAAMAKQWAERGGTAMPADWRLLRALAEQGVAPSEVPMLNRDGQAVHALLALAPLPDARRGGNGLLAVAADLTRIKQLEEDLRTSESRAREANEAKSAFLAAMSHEIRTPMIGVTGMVEILAHTNLDAEQRRSLNVIQSSAQSLLQIIGDILDFSKIEAGRMQLSPAATDLGKVARGVVANFSGSASSKGLVLGCSIDPQLGAAYWADALRLRQVLGNFVSNAIKFTERGRIDLALELQRRDGDRDVVCFRVSDTGIGVGKEAQAKLFQPFVQAEGDTTRRFGGTGLGLAICRRLAELMGGEVTMESEPGQGTTMRLLVPLQAAPEEEVETDAFDAIAPAAAGLAPRRLPSVAEAEAERSLVLLVDDHPTNRMVIARQLALAGYASEAAEDGAQGLAAWRSGRYALVLSDVHMPHMDGYQMARAIRTLEAKEGRGGHTPIVALTAATLKGEVERCLDAGMDDYLAKPVAIPTLVAALQRWLPHTATAATPPATPVDAPAPATALPQLHRPPPFDENVLATLTGGNDADLRALLDDYLASTREDLAVLEAARIDGDLPALTRQAHKLKGAARTVGALELADAAERLEAAARDGDWMAVPPLATDVATAGERLQLHVAERWPG
ncbi:hybrid sensor histidine kinase/response regulator [Pseudoluteimonas lycopersici]|uniref:hybrid sensor histidine kinase/response regulator n=1 Tax=Pseudoluteimonas lycopersici TaxID=1324796 RepID=UPI00163D57F2|nr:ATP-binding protein [Lysobacter lycopersici]